MDSYIVRIYRRAKAGADKKLVGTVEDVTRSKTMPFQGMAELEQALKPMPKVVKKKNHDKKRA